jgi:predicted transcriptional regulator
MTLREVAQQLGKSEKTIYKNFHRTQETLAKKGIILTKWGKGENTEYEIEYDELEEE